MISFEPTHISAIKTFREYYFSEIKLSQELYLEWMVKGGTCYKIYNSNQPVGYFILSKDNILIEFYLARKIITRKEEIFKIILSEFSIKKIYCKSFDSVLLVCGHTFSGSSSVIGTIFRDYDYKIYFDLEHSVTVRLATEIDLPYLLAFDSELYETPEELRYTVGNKMVYMFEKSNKLVGCGYLIKILADKNYYDIGMWVNPDFRNKGYAAMIISYLKKHCHSHSYIPVCGCAVDNIASRKTLEKNGFISKYSIIEFDV